MPGGRGGGGGWWARLELPEPLLTKLKVKMAGYWPSSSVHFYGLRRGQWTGPGHLVRISLVNKRLGLGLKLLTLGVGDSLPLTSRPEKENNGSKGLSPTPSNLSPRPCRYLSTVTRSSSRGSVDGFRRESFQRFATFNSLSVQRPLRWSAQPW